MKKLIIILITAGAFFVSSCGKKLDIQPIQSISQEEALSNDQNIKKILNGAYDGLSNASLLGGDLQLFSELLAADGEITWVGTFNQPREIFGKNIITTNSYVTATWNAGYSTINVCNNVLSAIDKVVPDDQDRVRGEALFIRGLVYFELIELYAKPYSAGANSGPGIPIVLEPTTGITEASYVSRNTIEEVYQQILSDLTTAEGLLPDENDVYATNSAAAAILSRVYLQMGNFAAAGEAANRVIGYGAQSLVTNYYEAFNNDDLSREDVFAIDENDQDNTNDMQLFWSVPAYGGRDGDVEVNDKHLNFYAPADDRLALFYFGNGAVRSGKWQLLYKNVPVVRLSEMYLTRAEANLRLGTAVGNTPLSDVNRIRARVGLPPLGSVTLDDILLERKLEVAHEGQAIHDVKRLQKSVDGFAYNANELVFPIPQREINANPNLVQNDGY
jgi:tetratricopeptide (TPR) repeat protein